MNIHIVTIAYGLAEDTDNLVRNTVSDNHDLTWHLFLHSQYPDVIKVCKGLSRLRKTKIDLYDYGENRGVAKSWNEGIINAFSSGADCVMLANDDIIVPVGDLDKIAHCVANPLSRLTGMVFCSGHDERRQEYGSMSFGFVTITRMAYEVVGMFDEQFVPMYYEDRDYEYRHWRSGLQVGYIGSTNLIHKGSTSIHTVPGLMEQHNRTFPANQQYYVKKWGGLPGEERYDRPFNDIRFGLRIADSDRERPYWGYERDDLEGLVKI